MILRISGLFLLCLLLGSAESGRAGEHEAERAQALDWARSAHVPLARIEPGAPWTDLGPIDGMVGDATLVGLSEAVHLGAEPLEFRNRLFQYLVEHKGFTAIAIESGIVEGRLVHDYVRGGGGSLQETLDQGISWTFDRLPQNRDLIRWMRDYNARPGVGRKINFYGFDVPGSPGNPAANRGVGTALAELVDQLSGVDADAAASMRFRIRDVLGRLRFDMSRPQRAPGYESLGQGERDALTAAIADTVALLERSEAEYVAKIGADRYQWMYRSAIAARQVDAWLRRIPPGWEPPAGAFDLTRGEYGFFSVAIDVRDRAQADNLDWIVQREGPSGKVLVFASRYHLSAVPITTPWTASGPGMPGRQQVAGTYLRRRYGDAFVNIGNLVRGGDYGCGKPVALARATPASMDGFAAELEVPRFLLDLRAAPRQALRWFERRHQYGPDAGEMKGNVAGGFDVLFYLDAVTPACPPGG